MWKSAETRIVYDVAVRTQFACGSWTLTRERPVVVARFLAGAGKR